MRQDALMNEFVSDIKETPLFWVWVTVTTKAVLRCRNTVVFVAGFNYIELYHIVFVHLINVYQSLNLTFTRAVSERLCVCSSMLCSFVNAYVRWSRTEQLHLFSWIMRWPVSLCSAVVSLENLQFWKRSCNFTSHLRLQWAMNSIYRFYCW